MAQKAKTPPAPRAQAPKRRDTKSGGVLGSIPRWVVIAGAIAIGALAVAVVVLAKSGGGSSASDGDLKSVMTAAGCTLNDKKPFLPKNKVNFHADSPKLDSKVKWSTFPPSAGGHYGAWAVWGFYRSPINPRQVVHNLEHGAVVIWWGPKVPAATVDQLETFYRESPDSMVGTPITGLGDKIALTAWTGDPATYYRKGDYGIGHIAVCSKFDQKAFAAFRSAYRGKGPEGIPESSNTPGSGP